MKFKNTMTKLTLHKSPGLNGVFPNVLKVLDDDNTMIWIEICSKYFEGNYDIKEWQVGSLTILPKNGNLSNPNNWKGIHLLDIVTKTIFNAITSRLQTILLV